MIIKLYRIQVTKCKCQAEPTLDVRVMNLNSLLNNKIRCFRLLALGSSLNNQKNENMAKILEIKANIAIKYIKIEQVSS